jgi:Mg-chelatase subunit ChlD
MGLMRTVILILIAALALGAAASAAYPVELAVTSDRAWMLADGKETATITATVTLGTGEHAGDPIEGANVTFGVNSPWQVKDSHLVTDKKGQVTTTLMATTVSGTANITVTASYPIYTETWGFLDYSSTVNLNQQIDHLAPASIYTAYKSQIQVRTPTLISVLVRDKYGNPVDNRNVVEQVQFDASSAGISGFLSGDSYVKSLIVPVNATGYADVLYLVDPVGANYVSIVPPLPIKQKLITIEGLSQIAPFSATSIVSPGGTPYPYTTVKTGTFTIGFTFSDQYGYPTINQPVNVTTGTGESMSFTTNKNGMVFVTYGPKDIAGLYTVTAKAANNLSVSTSVVVEFVSGEPSDAFLTASPQTMASRDVKDDITSILTMRVVDQKGNPVEGEAVSFRFASFSVLGKFNQTQEPVLENGAASTSARGVDITAVSNVNGEATVTFHPGAFTTDSSLQNYYSQAEGTAVVEAQWSTVTRQMSLRYVNYPYLTVQSWVTPSLVKVNDTIDITVKVSGDGWALQPKPAKVILVTDRSGSMLYDNPDRMYSATTAAKLFVDKMSPTSDKVGLVSFGWKGNISRPGVNSAIAKSDINNAYIYPKNYSDYATLDTGLGTPFPTVKNVLDQIVPDGGTPLRYGLKLAIDQLVSSGNANDKSVKAVIVLSDGDYNYYGDPLARAAHSASWPTDPSKYTTNLDTRWLKFTGSGLSAAQQNMSEYARAKGIRIFTIGFAQGISPGGQEVLGMIANGSGGKYYYAPTADRLGGIYEEIAGTLKDTAGVNTTMNISFQNIVVNNVTVPGEQVYNYTYLEDHSTKIDYWNDTMHFTGYPMTVDSSAQWNSARNISFNIGTVRLSQYWQATFTLEVLKEGVINVFGPGSEISTQDSPMPLKIPDVYVTALPNNTIPMLAGGAHLQVRDLVVTNAGTKSSADLRWNLVYDGIDTVSEDVMIAPYGTEDQWIHMPEKQASNTTTTDTASVPVSGLADGYYTIQVDGKALDADPASDYINIYYSEATGIEVIPDGTPIVTSPTTTIKPRIKIS